MNETKKWFAVCTHPGAEKKVINFLNRNKIEHYYPVTKVAGQKGKRKKNCRTPLFNSFIFVKVAEQDHVKLRKYSGILNFLHWLKKPVEIPEEEITIIRNFLDEHECVLPVRIAINRTDKMQVISSLSDIEENVLKVGAEKIKIYKTGLPTLGYVLSAAEELIDVELITPSLQNHLIIYPLPAVK
jgi:transcription antitermination factor NusG